MSKLVRPLSAVFSLGVLLAAFGASSPAGAHSAGPPLERSPWYTIDAMTAGSTDDVWGVGSYTGVNYWHALTEHWNGTRWQRVPTPDDDLVILAGVSETAPDDVWAVGTSGGTPAPYILHWDGSSWSVVPSAPRVTVGFLWNVEALSADDVWAVGNRQVHLKEKGLIEHWDGQKWSAVRTPPAGQQASPTWIRGLGFSSPTDGWAVGGPAATVRASLHWDGSRWRKVPLPLVTNSAYGSVAALSPTDAWLVGSRLLGPHNQHQPITAHWDGEAWTSVPFPEEHDGDLNSVVAIGPDDVWAFGDYLAGQDPRLRLPLVGHFDGSAWTVYSMPRGKAAKTYLNGATAIGPDDIWTSGAAGKSVFFRHWDGSGWS